MEKEDMRFEEKYGGMDLRDAALLTDEEKRELENESEEDNAKRTK